MPHTFNPSDSRSIESIPESGDVPNLTHAREEISTVNNNESIDRMTTDTSNGILPSGEVDDSGSIVFRPKSIDNVSGNHQANDGHNHNSDTSDVAGSDNVSGNHQANDGHNHTSDSSDVAGSDNASANHQANDGHNHSGGVTNSDNRAGNHQVNDGHNHTGANQSANNLDGNRLNDQAKMSQEAARLGLGARDTNLIQQLEGSVPHSSPRELAKRLKAARDRGGMLDFSKHAE